jgi:hypothetical protein
MKTWLTILFVSGSLSASAQISYKPVRLAPLYPFAPVKKVATIHTEAKPVTVKSPVGPRDYYQQQFGFFCKQEWQFEKQTRFAVKVRLGSYQEAQRLEGK